MEREQETRSARKGQMLLGYVVLGAVAVGVIGVVMAFVAWGAKDWGGGGLCLIAAAIAFGSMLTALGR